MLDEPPWTLIFSGGISWEEKLKEYLENYGEVGQTAVMREKFTVRPRGFGFAVLSDSSVLEHSHH